MQCGKINMMKRLALSPRNIVNFYAHQLIQINARSHAVARG